MIYTDVKFKQFKPSPMANPGENPSTMIKKLTAIIATAVASVAHGATVNWISQGATSTITGNNGGTPYSYSVSTSGPGTFGIGGPPYPLAQMDMGANFITSDDGAWWGGRISSMVTGTSEATARFTATGTFTVDARTAGNFTNWIIAFGPNGPINITDTASSVEIAWQDGVASSLGFPGSSKFYLNPGVVYTYTMVQEFTGTFPANFREERNNFSKFHVPDSGSTLGLMAIGLVGAAGVARLRRRQA